MKFLRTFLVVALVAVCAPSLWAQLGAVKGFVHDFDGKPIVGGVVSCYNKENGRKFELKTDKKGEFYSLGVVAGRYNCKILKEGKEIWNMGNVPVTTGEENTINFDLAKEAQQQQQQVPPEVRAQQEAQQKEAQKIKGLNDKLAAAEAAQNSGDFATAISTLTEATQLDPTKDLLWYRLAEVERIGATKTADASAKTTMMNNAIEHYKKAIAIKPVGAYYNNLGEAYAKAGNTQEAMNAYAQAAAADPTNAAQYYYNEGAILTNTGKVDDAIKAFDKAIQADPSKADAYYWKGVNLLGKATLKGDKMEAPPGTAEAFNKYLELQPTGPFAEPSKQMLASMGEKVETSFGKGKGKKK